MSYFVHVFGDFVTKGVFFNKNKMIEIEIKRLKRISNYGLFMQHDNIQIYSMTGVVPSQDSFGTLKDGTPVSRYVLDAVILSGFTYKLRSNSVFLFLYDSLLQI